MKLCLILQIDGVYGGAERRLARTLLGIKKRGQFECELVLYGVERYATMFVNQENLSEIPRLFFDSQIKCIRYLCKQFNTVIWFFNLNHVAFFMEFLFPHKNRFYLFSIVNVNLSYMFLRSRKQRLIFPFLLKHSDAVDCLYPSAIAKLEKEFKRNFFCTPCPFTNVDEYVPLKKKKTIVFASRLVPGKNVAVALEAINMTRKTIEEKGYKVIICGTGVLKDTVSNYIQNNNLSELVEYIGFVSLKTVLGESSIFLSLQTITNYPSQVLLESISCGNFIVATNTTDTNLVVKQEFGVLVDPNATSISYGIRYALDVVSVNGFENTSSKAREFAKENFCVNRSVSYFENICDSLQYGKKN